MPYPQLDRHAVIMRPLADRHNKLRVEADHIQPDRQPGPLSDVQERLVDETVARIRAAREAGRPVMLTFGAHTIKNGLAPVLIALLEKGWLTHLATNGAGIIHDWEYAYFGQTSEDVRANVAEGTFGNWQETGFYLNLAIVVGACENRGYGESVGALIHHGQLTIPTEASLLDTIRTEAAEGDATRAAAAADLLAKIREFQLNPGVLTCPHPHRHASVQAAAFRLGIPLTGHPMIGHDIIYNHPMNHGAAIGRAAQRDFLTFAESVSRLDGGVYLSVGSAVMSPMVFEKSLSMGQNLAIQRGVHIDRHFILVADLAKSTWDWSQGEPPPTSPDYYLRYNKSFNRMGGTMRYICIDNRDLLLALHHRLA